MIDSNRVVAVIPARGGSKSVPLKNLHLLGGKPLLAWPIETALATSEIDRVIVSTDDERIAAAGEKSGAEIYSRPSELATDHAYVADVLRNLRSRLISEGESADIVVLLEATSPFRSPELISRCLRRIVTEGLDSVATFHEAAINPERVWTIENEVPRPFLNDAVPWKPRQQLRPAFQLNGAVYAYSGVNFPASGPAVLFGKMGAEILPANEVIDIDDYKDFIIANAILESRKIAAVV